MFREMIKVLKVASLAGVVVASASTSPAGNFQVISVGLIAQPARHAGQCPATITFVGRIKVNGPGRVRYTFLRSDGARGPVFDLDFDAAGEKQVARTWSLGGTRLPFYRGWEAIRVLAPNGMVSNRARFEVRCLSRQGLDLPSPPQNEMLPPEGMSFDTTMAGSGKLGGSRVELLPAALASDIRPNMQPDAADGAKPDLIVSLIASHTAFAGQDISNRLGLTARNRGAAPAQGTRGAIDPAGGYMIDLILSRDVMVPERPAILSRTFVEDALLPGGRRSITFDLPPGAARLYRGQARIPADTPTGNYFLCARIDSGSRVVESNERNNTTCVPMHITGRNR